MIIVVKTATNIPFNFKAAVNWPIADMTFRIQSLSNIYFSFSILTFGGVAFSMFYLSLAFNSRMLFVNSNFNNCQSYSNNCSVTATDIFIKIRKHIRKMEKVTIIYPISFKIKQMLNRLLFEVYFQYKNHILSQFGQDCPKNCSISMITGIFRSTKT